jgi:hypothetical protein
MAAKKRTSTKRVVSRVHSTRTDIPAASSALPVSLRTFLKETSIPKNFVNAKPLKLSDLRKRVMELNLRLNQPLERLLPSVNRIRPAAVPVDKLPEEFKASVRALKPGTRRFHGAKLPLSWFPFPGLISPCADRFGYMSSAATRAATKLPFNVTTQALLGQLGGLMGDPGRDPNPTSNLPSDAGVSAIPAGFTYFGQFVDHDITFDISSSIDVETDANTINNMRSPSLDLDSVYGRGPGLDPFLYAFPSSGPSTAIKFQTGTNTNTGPGGPSSTGTIGRNGHPIPMGCATYL